MRGDFADQAQAISEADLELALKNKRPEAPKETTHECLTCGAEVEPPRRWCDRSCTALWERANG